MVDRLNHRLQFVYFELLGYVVRAVSFSFVNNTNFILPPVIAPSKQISMFCLFVLPYNFRVLIVFFKEV